MTLSDAIKSYREGNALSQRQFANKCGLSNGYIAMIEREINPSTGEPIKPTIAALKKLANGMGISMGELFAMVDDIGVSMADELPDNVIPMPALRRVPRLGAIACGEPILAEQNIEEYDTIPAWVHCDFTLACKGDSMINARIYDGDLVCIKEQPTAESGQIAAVLINGEYESDATLKRVRYIPGGVALWPENPAYEPLIFTGEDVNRIRIIGVATHFISAVR